MSEPRTVDPSECPTPRYHKTFRYCPSCSWHEPVASDIDRALVGTFYTQDDWARVLDAFEAYETTLTRIGDDVRRRENLPPYGPWPRGVS